MNKTSSIRKLLRANHLFENSQKSDYELRILIPPFVQLHKKIEQNIHHFSTVSLHNLKPTLPRQLERLSIPQKVRFKR